MSENITERRQRKMSTKSASLMDNTAQQKALVTALNKMSLKAIVELCSFDGISVTIQSGKITDVTKNNE